MGTVCAKQKAPKLNQIQQEQSMAMSLPVEQHSKIEKVDLKRSSMIVPKKKQKIRETVKAVKHTNEEGHKMLNDYVMDEFLGQGSFGKVKAAFKRQGDKDVRYAIKILSKSKLKRQREYIKDAKGVLVVKDALQDVKREIAVMKKLKHKNLIQLFEVIDNPESDKLFMVLEFASGGQLIEWDDDEQVFYKNRVEDDLSEGFLKILFRDCIRGLHYLHQNGIVHRDLKPQNVLNSAGVAKIADFGVSQIVGDNDALINTQGTYHFMPPEACDKDRVKGGYSGKAADIWALGVTFYAFTYLNVPFNGSSVPEIMQNISTQELTFPDIPVSDGLKDFLKFLLNKDQKERPNIEEASKHTWLNEGLPNLCQEINKVDTVDISEQEIENAYSLSSILRIKNWASKWKTSSNLKKQSLIQSTNSKEQQP